MFFVNLSNMIFFRNQNNFAKFLQIYKELCNYQSLLNFEPYVVIPDNLFNVNISTYLNIFICDDQKLNILTRRYPGQNRDYDYNTVQDRAELESESSNLANIFEN